MILAKRPRSDEARLPRRPTRSDAPGRRRRKIDCESPPRGPRSRRRRGAYWPMLPRARRASAVGRELAVTRAPKPIPAVPVGPGKTTSPPAFLARRGPAPENRRAAARSKRLPARSTYPVRVRPWPGTRASRFRVRRGRGPGGDRVQSAATRGRTPAGAGPIRTSRAPRPGKVCRERSRAWRATPRRSADRPNFRVGEGAPKPI